MRHIFFVFKLADGGLGALPALLGHLVVKPVLARVVGHRLDILPRAHDKEIVRFGQPAGHHMLAELRELFFVLLALLDVGVDAGDRAGKLNDPVRFCGRFLLGPGPAVAIRVVQMMDGVVVDLLGQAGGSLGQIDAAQDLEKRPRDVLPQLVRIGVPGSLLVVDGQETGPEEDEEDRSKPRVGRLSVSVEEGAQDVVFAGILRFRLHEGDDVGPRVEGTQSRCLLTQAIQHRLVIVGGQQPFEPLAI